MRTYSLFMITVLFILFSNKAPSQKIASSIIPGDFLVSVIDERNDINQQFRRLSFFDDDFNFLSYKKKNISIGVNTFFEEDLPDNNLKFSDFFVYDFGLNFAVNQLQFSLFVENFFNRNNNELSIEPVYVENNNTLVYLEHDTPSMIQLSLVYSF